MLNISVRKALVIPTALTLALGGALLSASAANAAPVKTGSLTVDSSYNGTPQTYRVSLTGTAPTDGTNVDQVDLFSGATDLGGIATTTDAVSGTYALQYAFTTSTQATDLSVHDVTDPSQAPVPISIVLPVTTITSPTSDQTINPGTLTISGSAPNGSTVTATDTLGSAAGPAVTVTDGTDTSPGTYSVTLDVEPSAGTQAEAVHAVTVLSDGSPTPEATQFVSFPVSAPTPTLTVTSPANTTAAAPYTPANRHFTITGAGTAGDLVNISAGDDLLGQVTVGADNTYSAEVGFEATAANNEVLTLTQATPATDGTSPTLNEGDLVTVYVTLPAAPVVLAPVIIKPSAGSATGTVNVTFTGTSQPGTYVSVQALPTVLYVAASSANPTPAQLAAANAIDPSTIPDPTNPVLVDAAGNWTVTEALAVGDWTAIAVDAANADGLPVDVNDFVDATAASDPQQFFVTAAVVAAAANITPAAGTLAFTGSQDTTPMIVGAGLLLMAGVGLTVVARRRRTLND